MSLRAGPLHSRGPEWSGVDPHDPIGEIGEIDVGSVGEQDDREALVRVTDDEGLVSVPAPRMLQAAAPEILLEEPAEGVVALAAVVETHRPQRLVDSCATHQSPGLERLVPATEVVERRVDGAAPDEAVEGVIGAGGEA